MLQQTQVARVESRHPEFLAEFPTAAACASAPVGAVIQAWAGLGYNRRALRLHRAATEIVERHGGRVPDVLDDLLALSGVGTYTARAVSAFAFERDVGVVDTNAARVLARWCGRPLTQREVQAAADEAVPSGEGWAWNQAMLDLGAMVCGPSTPRCDECPVSEHCAWFAAGRPDPDPIEGTHGTARAQSRFEGSDRQGRGRLVDALRSGPVRADALAQVMGWPDDPERARRVAATLVADGLAVEAGGEYRLP